MPSRPHALKPLRPYNTLSMPSPHAPTPPYAEDLSAYTSPKPTRSAAAAGQLSQPGTGERPRWADDSAHVIALERRCLDLEAALRETEAALSASELQVEQVQLEGTPILEPDSSGEDSGFSGDDDPEMNLAGDSNQGGGGGGAAADTTAAQQEWGPILQKMRAKHDTSAAERAARQR